MSQASLSVVVPTFNRPDQLSECLRCLAAQTIGSRAFETVVVDDGGDASLERILEPFDSHLELRLERRENGGPAAARNFGLEKATGDWIAFTDDDCLPEPNWLERLCAAADFDDPLTMVGGAISNVLEKNSFSAASQLVLDLVYDHYNADASAARFLVTMNLLVSRAALVGLGAFDVRFRTAEDRELCDRWLAAGYRMVYAPDARVGHAHALDLGGFCRQHFGYGLGADRYHRVRADRRSGSMVTESRFHLELPRLLAARSRTLGRGRVLSLTPHLLAWQVFNAAGFAWARLAGPRSA